MHDRRKFVATDGLISYGTHYADAFRRLPINLTNEYFPTARDYGLGYRVLKAIDRNALIHSFLNERQTRDELERFDRSYAEFERSVASRQSPLQNAMTLISGGGPAHVTGEAARS
jgi:hypothetical protein